MAIHSGNGPPSITSLNPTNLIYNSSPLIIVLLCLLCLDYYSTWQRCEVSEDPLSKIVPRFFKISTKPSLGMAVCMNISSDSTSLLGPFLHAAEISKTSYISFTAVLSSYPQMYLQTHIWITHIITLIHEVFRDGGTLPSQGYVVIPIFLSYSNSPSFPASTHYLSLHSYFTPSWTIHRHHTLLFCNSNPVYKSVHITCFVVKF